MTLDHISHDDQLEHDDLAPPPTSLAQTTGRLALSAVLVATGTGHLSFARREFQAQVPDWVPLDKDTTVFASGVVELLFAAGLLWPSRRRGTVGLALAAFFVAVFPGNLAQWWNRRSSFGLDTDAKRFGRLFGQPMLVAWALWSTGAWSPLSRGRARSR